MSISKTILVGRCGSEPEQRHFPSGGSVTTVSLATSETWKKDGQKQERTTWHTLKFFGGLSDVVSKYVRKGDQIYTEGIINTEEWEKDGQKHYKTVIKCNELQMLGGTQQGNTAQSNTGQSSPPAHDFDDFSDSIPF